ncbi:MAG: carboxypeptidase-like regulatory domain-containing protein [Flavobacteriaceae bacterium]
MSLCWGYTTMAQEVLFEGHVYDSGNKKPIPYVNLSFLNTLKGTSTDEEGHFFLDIPEAYLEKQVHISSLGYNDTIVLAKDIHSAQRIEMTEESFELDEVVLVEKLDHTYVLNPIMPHDLTSGFSSSYTPWVLALYFPNIGAQKKYVEKVTVFVQRKTEFRREASKFRLRIYDVDPETKKPRHDILRKSVVIQSSVDKDFVSIDVSALNIQMPQEGIFIGLEWLFVPYNWYKSTVLDDSSGAKKVEDRFAPTFGGVYNRNANYRAMVYGMGEWNDFVVMSKDRTKNFIPAISLKIARE